MTNANGAGPAPSHAHRRHARCSLMHAASYQCSAASTYACYRQMSDETSLLTHLLSKLVAARDKPVVRYSTFPILRRGYFTSVDWELACAAGDGECRRQRRQPHPHCGVGPRSQSVRLRATPHDLLSIGGERGTQRRQVCHFAPPAVSRRGSAWFRPRFDFEPTLYQLGVGNGTTAVETLMLRGSPKESGLSSFRWSDARDSPNTRGRLAPGLAVRVRVASLDSLNLGRVDLFALGEY